MKPSGKGDGEKKRVICNTCGKEITKNQSAVQIRTGGNLIKSKIGNRYYIHFDGHGITKYFHSVCNHTFQGFYFPMDKEVE
jgi:hypothetical protein